MHLLILLSALVVAFGLRMVPVATNGSAADRWRRSLGRFLFSPLLLVMTGIALLWMGPQGQMVRWWEGWLSYSLAIGFLISTVALGLKLTIEGGRSLHQVRTYPELKLQGHPGRLLPTSMPFIAQVGFWHPELVVSQGLLDTFDADHLQAVMVHEQAHSHYRDTFWFFCMGWLRRATIWLPQTETLWQELLALRELRADRWASQQVDSLLLAEALVQMVSVPDLYPENFSAAFSSATPQNRLQERIEALLSEPETQRSSLWAWTWLVFIFLPLATVPFHY